MNGSRLVHSRPRRATRTRVLARLSWLKAEFIANDPLSENGPILGPGDKGPRMPRVRAPSGGPSVRHPPRRLGIADAPLRRHRMPPRHPLQQQPRILVQPRPSSRHRGIAAPARPAARGCRPAGTSPPSAGRMAATAPAKSPGRCASTASQTGTARVAQHRRVRRRGCAARRLRASPPASGPPPPSAPSRPAPSSGAAG